MELSHKRTSLQKLFDDANAISNDIMEFKKDCKNLKNDCNDLCRENGCYSDLWGWIVKLLSCFCCLNV
jgi:hypothetical protein